MNCYVWNCEKKATIKIVIEYPNGRIEDCNCCTEHGNQFPLDYEGIIFRREYLGEAEQ